ncbi:hypothetical protein Q3P04_21385 [Ralstonia pseudosolanacearum]|uniref:hypothetical protein n=1 Tax=Ralstonia pseudosolanacearum TaxID=1310165 RepID=UPI0026775E51|nr:hypothetical protein [Ralstonia pseudosolanacearum]MDO3583677.1 hypothetical protein [Ralstonia pseudosolanacearum]
MNGIDPNNVFALLVSCMSTADAISQDTRLTMTERAAAGRLRDSLKSWKGVAFVFKDWTPAPPAKPEAPTA